jgi:hypothetical protein
LTDQYRTFTAVIVQVIGSSDLTAAVGSLGRDWSMLLSSYMYPDDPFGEPNLIPRHAVNYLLYSCFRSVAAARILVLDAMPCCLREIENRECIFHIVPVLIQLLREAVTLPFSFGLIRSQL